MPVTERQEPIQKCFKSLEYIAKFVIQSRHLFSRATGGHSEDSFVVDIHLVFNSVNKMMSSTNDTVLQVDDIKVSLFAAAFYSLGIVFITHVHGPFFRPRWSFSIISWQLTVTFCKC